MMLWQQQALFAKHVGLLIEHIFSMGYYCTLGDAFRSTEQAEIYANQGKGIKDSLHCKRLAIDLNLISQNGKYLTNYKDYERFGIFWESLDPENRWGGNFYTIKDGNHFQRNEIITGKTL